MTAKNKGHGDLQICDTCIFMVRQKVGMPQKYKDLMQFVLGVVFSHIIMCNNTRSSHYRHILHDDHGCGMYEKKE